MNDDDIARDEQERRTLQEYIFDLEAFKETADSLSAENEKLKHSQNLLMAILGSAKNGISMVKNRKLEWCNQGFTDMLGWRREEIAGMSVAALYPNEEEFIKRGREIYGESPQSSIESFEYDFVHKDGRRVSCLATGRALDENDLSKGYIFSFTDITARKLAEENLKNAKAEAEAANQAKTDFLANMSHELRTPLNHIIGFTELVVDKNFGELNETQEEYLGDALSSGRHLLSLINDILDLSKVEAGKLELEPTYVDLKALLETSLVMIREKAMKQGIALSIHIDGILPTITADERKLKQIMYNLLSNAVKFTPDGGEIRLKADLADGDWLIADHRKEKASDQKINAMGYPLNPSRKFVRISVADSGIGIKPQDLERIFNPFEQVEHSANSRFKGTGLGLSLTRRLVELHGGRIRAESEGEGRGSRIVFVIPICDQSGDRQ